ncbi:protein MOS2 [Neltuma alba]|uniref:protein MOS2 n=1 Tax=Neltuma alba TaxID=207710 RepID=UPI0010A48A57|nr:protein MOS2 [Prosopis alba]
MKLSFSVQSKSNTKSNPIRSSNKFDAAASDTKDGKSNAREYVTEFDASKSPSDPNKATTVIPPIENEWNLGRSYKRMKNLDLPITESNVTELGFELDTSTVVEPGSDMSYGLNLRQTKKNDGDGEKPAAGSGGDDSDNNGRSRPVSLDSVVLQKFKDDMERLPDHRGFEEFKDVAVEGFGAALLAGYGWREGMGIGKNAKEDVKVVQYERRTAKEGLGFVSDHARKRNSKEEVKIPKEHGREGSLVGKVVRIVEGKNAGLKGKIVREVEDKWVVLKLVKSEEEVKVGPQDFVELGSIEEERFLKKLKELKIQDTHKDRDSRNKRNREEGRRGRDEVVVDVKRDSRKEEQGKKRVSWLTSHIRVRVISKDFKGGRLYLKKGQVLDVVGPTTCDISIDDSKEIIQGISQDLLETAIPRRGGPVLVLYGKHKGIYGSLVERDLDKEMAVVRDADTHALVNVRLEQIAEFIGDPSILGY